MLSIVDVAPFEAINSSGVRTRDGSSACRAGLIRVEDRPIRPAKTNTSVVFSAKAATADPARAIAPRSIITMRKRSRRKRSPSEAANGAMTPAGNSRTSPATPTAEVPPCW
jgi:hypothetical protein